jgi:protein TonB
VPAAPPPRPPVGERGPVLPPWAPPILVVSPIIPPEIPAPSPNRPFDPGAFYLPGDSGGVPWGQPRDTGRVVRPDGVYMADVLEERPERVGGPPPRFPEILRQAGIGGRVIVECVVDTMGRVESGSLRVVSSTNALFDSPAREAVAASLFRPGRLGARAVRVRVQVPLNFEIARFQ